MNLSFQIARHLALHLKQWPKKDPKKAEADIRQRLLTGNAWLWPDPEQMELFA